MKGILIHLRSQPEPRFWTLFGEIRADLDRLYWCFDNQPWMGAPAEFDDSIPVWFLNPSNSSVMLWRPGSLSRLADKFREEQIRLWGIDAEKHHPADVAAAFSANWNSTPLPHSTVALEYTDSTCWEIYSSESQLLERVNRSLPKAPGIMLYDMEWKHRERDFRAALGYWPGKN